MKHYTPKFLIDDTAEISDARIFVMHTEHPRFIGELLPSEEALLSGVTFSCIHNQTLCKVQFIDDPSDYDLQLISGPLNEAIKHHDSVRLSI